MITTIFHTILYILSIIILAAIAVIMCIIACVAVKMIFLPSNNDSDETTNNEK